MNKNRVKCDLSPEITTCLRLANTVRPDCCRVVRPIPYDAQCFIRDIGKELKKLQARHDNHMAKIDDRLTELAIPRNCRTRFVPRCACPFTKTIQIVPADPPAYTRTEQLALPTVRRLLYRRQNAIDVNDKIGVTVLNRWLRYSYMSLYSRLCNIQPMKKPYVLIIPLHISLSKIIFPIIKIVRKRSLCRQMTKNDTKYISKS